MFKSSDNAACVSIIYKRCRSCNEQKPIGDFSQSVRHRDKHESSCTDCEDKARRTFLTELNGKIVPMTFVCNRCRVEKSISNFHLCPACKHGLRNTCRQCMNNINQERRLLKLADDQIRLKLNDMLVSARTRAKRDGIPFNIELDYLLAIFGTVTICPVLKTKLDWSSRGRFNIASPTLDRIEPDKGYVVGNILLVSFLANAMKSDGSFEDLKKFSEYWLQKLLSKAA